jgi:hypothetical protein
VNAACTSGLSSLGKDILGRKLAGVSRWSVRLIPPVCGKNVHVRGVRFQQLEMVSNPVSLRGEKAKGGLGVTVGRKGRFIYLGSRRGGVLLESLPARGKSGHHSCRRCGRLPPRHMDALPREVKVQDL